MHSYPLLSLLKRGVLSLLTAGIFCAAATAEAQSPEVLPSIEGNLTYPGDVNNQGVVIGNTYDPTLAISAVRWVNGQIQRLAGFPLSIASAINDSGTIVGAGYESRESSPAPVVWEDGVPRVLPTLGYGGIALDINAAGDVVGWVNTDRSIAPALWRAGKLTVLPGFFDNGGEATAIDESGRISGVSYGLEYGDRVPTQWLNRAAISLPVTFGENYIGVLGINRSGAGRTSGFLVQREFLEDGSPYLINLAVCWQDGEFRILPRPFGRGNSVAYGVNAEGIYVGSTEDAEGYTIPTLWDQEGATSLPLDAGHSAVAVAANETGLVVGYDKTDGRHPIPVIWRRNTFGRILMPNMQTTPGSLVTLQATVKKAGKPVGNQAVEFRVNNARIGRAVSNAQGLVKLNYRVPAAARGRLNVMVSPGGKTAAFRSIVINRSTTTAAVAPVRTARNQTARLVATLRNTDLNMPLANRQVSFVVRGQVMARAVTSPNGVASATYRIPANMTPARLPIEIRYGGDAETNGTVGRSSLRIVR